MKEGKMKERFGNKFLKILENNEITYFVKLF